MFELPVKKDCKHSLNCGCFDVHPDHLKNSISFRQFLEEMSVPESVIKEMEEK